MSEDEPDENGKDEKVTFPGPFGSEVTVTLPPADSLRGILLRQQAEAVASAPKIDWEAERKKERAARLEKLAALEHEQWCYWTRNLVSSGRIPDWLVAKWRPNWVPYGELSEELKEHDRIWARRALAIMEER
jgi:hypothetical protein